MIELKNIEKTYKVKKREAGIKNALKSFTKGKYEEVKALSGISFKIDEGEIVGYIGPNGAGKSTTIKIMCGILTPDSGECTINGMVPYKERKKYVKNIGVVFGNRSGLWWDVPVDDSFELIKSIYRIPDSVYKKQKEMLKKVISNKMSVRTLEEEIAKMLPPKEPVVQANTNINDIPLNRNAFVNDNPIAPTTEMPEDNSQYGQVRIVPPDGEPMPTQRFINYGEIDKEEVEEPKDSYYNKVEVQPVDVSTIKENAMDIKPNTNEPQADLDNLLNIQSTPGRYASTPSVANKTQEQYLTPAEAIVKGEQPEDVQKDYFNLPNIKIPDMSQNMTQPAAQNQVSILNIPEPVQQTNSNYTVEDAINRIREAVKDIESHGVKVTFDTAYQVIIKVDK